MGKGSSQREILIRLRKGAKWLTENTPQEETSLDKIKEFTDAAKAWAAMDSFLRTTYGFHECIWIPGSCMEPSAVKCLVCQERE